MKAAAKLYWDLSLVSNINIFDEVNNINRFCQSLYMLQIFIFILQ